MKKTFTITLSLLSVIFSANAQVTDSSSTNGNGARIFGGVKNKTQTILELNNRIDSLQRAYDSLYVEYQTLLAPVNMDDPEDIIQDTSSVEYTPESIDSLFSAFYAHQQHLTEYNVDFESMDTDSLVSNIPDSVYIRRLDKLNSFIPLQFNKYVKNNIIRYTDKIPSATSRILGLAPYYLPEFEGIFDEYDMPKELKAMAVIESALNSKAVSRARAKGMWQFMYTTGRKYGLDITSFVDERYDPDKACRAAAQYLKDSYLIFGDWQLAIASYNCGSGNVRKAIRRSGGKTDFWDIYPYLPRETRGYIPAFIAALYVLEYYPEHGIVPQQATIPSHIDTFHISRMLHFQQISDNIGIPVEMLRDLNPQYIHDIVPGKEKTYILRLPYTYTNAFIDKEAEIYAYKDSVFFNEVAIKKIQESGGSDGQRIIHKVRKGETLGGIASKYRTSVNNIRRWNGLRSNTIYPGQKLAIYGRASGVSSSSSSGSASTSVSGGYSVYTVKSGDTLSGISKKTGVSLNSLYQLNNLGPKSKIYPGMKLKVKKV